MTESHKLAILMVHPRSLSLKCSWLPFLLGLTIAACGPASQPNQQLKPLKPLPQDPFIQAYFNQNPAAEYTEPYRPQTRAGDDLEQWIVETIASANSSVEVAVQELRLPKIARAIVDRHQAGVQVRVILENTYNRPWSDYTEAEIEEMEQRDRDRIREGQRFIDSNGDGQLSSEEIRQQDALAILREAGVPLLDDTADGSKGSGLMHHKFVIADDRTLIITSANFTPSGIHGDADKPASRGNANNLLRIESAELAALLEEEFNVMWGDGPGGQPNSRFGVNKPARSVRNVSVGEAMVSVQFSPSSAKIPWEQSSNGLIAKALSRANQSVDLALFVFSEQPLANGLETRHQQGVQVRALIDPSFAFREYSEGLDLVGVALANRACEYETGNRSWQRPIETVGVPLLPPGDKLHHKFAVIDDRLVVTGSHNWSAAANTKNDETLLVVQSPTVAAHFQREFDRLYANATLGLSAKVQQKIEQQQRQCPAPTVSIESDGPVNLNTASQKELETLPGVGPALAQRIIEARQQQRFTSLDDLDGVSGIGPSKLEQLRHRVIW